MGSVGAKLSLTPSSEAPLDAAPLRLLVFEGPETILKLDSWLVVTCKDGNFHMDGCPCEDCIPQDAYLAEAA